MKEKVKVFLTGAGGRTGRLVFTKLKAHPEFEIKGLVRRQEHLDELGPGLVMGDVREVVNDPAIQAAMADCDRLVILTSAMPKMRRGENPSDPPEWYFEPGEDPEQIDWVAARSQIDMAVVLGYKHIVLVSSMGVTRPDHPLNKLEKILMWKSLAERYLINSGVAYTIIHPGGLLDQPGGERELLVGVHDEFLDSETKAVPRADLAEVVAQVLLCPEALDKDFDLVSKAPGEGTPTSDFASLFDRI